MQIDFNEMEKKWQKKRETEQIYKTTENPNKEKFYILDMFPYPSGSGLHVGHPKGYVATDTLARKKMLEGFSVLHPMGFDTFGLGTEQYAIDNKMKPQDVATKNIAYYKQQLEKIWFSYDWSRSFSTADPDYFKWTQWVFLQLYTHYYDEEKKQARPIEEYKGENPDEVRLAYVDYKPINRCPHCKTGLANEDLDDGKCERCGSEVEQRPMRQWVLRITKYADRLLEGLDALDWDESMKELERNWIGKSSGTQFEMNVKNFGELEDNQLKDCEDSNQIILRNSLDNFQKFFSVFTTRIDTVFGMSFVVMAPEHTLVDQITTPKYKDAVAKYKEQAKFKTQLERTELQKEKTGQFTGAYAINPFNNEEVPIFIGDYVLANYGTGVVMAVPAHDERDFEFAKKYDIPIRTSIAWDYLDQDNPPQEGLEMTERNGVIVLIKHRSEEKYLCLEWKTQTWKDLITGGIEEGEDPIEAAKREVQEETWYKNFREVKQILFENVDRFCAKHKGVNRTVFQKNIFIELENGEQDRVSEEEKALFDAVWLTKEEMEQTINLVNHRAIFDMHVDGDRAFTEKGIVVNSWAFSWLTSDEAIKAMQKRLAERNLWGEKNNYKIQDRVFSRQRYWGEPFPVVFCKHCGEKAFGEHLYTINFYNQVTRNGIIKKIKTIETRALNPEEPERYFGNVKTGDILKMVNKNTGKAVYGKITECYLWKSFEELFNEPELENIYTDKEHFKTIITPEQLKKDWDFTDGYVEKIETNGMVGRKFELVDIAKINPLPISDLPLILPEVENYEPTGREEGPLDDVDRRMKTECPVCKNEAKRESNTMPGRAGSSWYRLRYMDPKNVDALVGKSNEQYWGNVDVYVGGAEHVTRHMIYARFWQKFLYDLGIVNKQEPFQKYEKVWLIMAEDGRKMSKRRGNVVNPDDVIAEYGADAFRTYEMFMGPFDQFISRNTNGLKGVKKFLDKVIALWDKVDENAETPKEVEILLHQTIKKTTEDIDAFRFNTTISQFMILVNKLTELDKINTQLFETFMILLAPFAPHLAEEFWSLLGNEFSIFTKAKWPTWDEKKLTSDTVQLAIQFNGKVRGTVETSPTANQEEVMTLIQGIEKLKEYLASGEIKKVIYVPGKIVNIVIA